METWKEINNYEGLYWASTDGKVKNRFGRILRPMVEWSGYLRLNLCKNGAVKKTAVHRIIAETFIPNPNNLPEVNHKNELKYDNRVENLEWMSSKDNCNYGKRNKLIKEKQSKKVYQYDKEGNLIKIWDSTQECAKYGYNQGHVAACCRGERKTHKNSLWSYDKKG